MDYFFPFYNDWVDADEEVVALIKEKVKGIVFSDETQFRTQRLPFYPDNSFIIVKDKHWEPQNVFVYLLQLDDEFKFLDGKSRPIHEINGNGKLKLNDDNIIDYLVFFTFFVRGEEGPFYVPRLLDSPYLPNTLRKGGNQDETNNETIERFSQVFQTPRVLGRDNRNVWRVSALVHYSNAVFVGYFEVQPTGMVDMKDDAPIIADLKAKIDAPLIPAESSSVSTR